MGAYEGFNPWEGMISGANMLNNVANAQEQRRGARIRNDAAEIDLRQKQNLEPMMQRAAEEDITAQFDTNALNRIKGYHEVSRYINGDPVLAEEIGKRMGADPQQLLKIKPISPETSVYDAGDGNKIVATMGPDGKMKVTKLVDPAASFNLAGKSQLLGEKAGYDMDRVNAQIAGHLAGIQLGANLKADAKPSLTTEQDETLRGMLRDGKLTAKQLRGMKIEDKAMIANTAMDNPDYNPLRSEEDSKMRSTGTTYRDYVALKAIPEVISNVESAGSKLDFSKLAFKGRLEKWMKGETNDPEFTEYMTFRNDAILSIARALKGGAASEFSMKLEEEAARPTMTPQALKSWVKAQAVTFEPRLKEYERLYGTSSKADAELVDNLKKYGTAKPTAADIKNAPPAPTAAETPPQAPAPVATAAKETPLSSLSPGEQRAIMTHPKWTGARVGDYVTLTNKTRGTIRIKKEVE